MKKLFKVVTITLKRDVEETRNYYVVTESIEVATTEVKKKLESLTTFIKYCELLASEDSEGFAVWGIPQVLIIPDKAKQTLDDLSFQAPDPVNSWKKAEEYINQTRKEATQ